MITFHKLNGWGTNFDNIKYVSTWADSFKGSGSLFFFPGPVELVVDVVLYDNNTLVIEHYTHNSQEVVERATILEDEIRALIKESEEKDDKRKSYTVCLADTPFIMRPLHFENFRPPKQPATTMFIFDTEIADRGFPVIHLMEKNQNGSNPEFLDVMALSATFVDVSADSPTKVGKEFAYFLLFSHLKSEPSLGHPALDAIKFPTRNGPGRLSMVALQEFCDTCSPEKVTVGKQGTSYAEDKSPKILPFPLQDANPFGLTEHELEEFLISQAAETKCIEYFSMYQYGLEKTLSLLPFSDEIIDVILNTASLGLRRMCIFEGKIHVLPASEIFDPSLIIEIGDEFLVVDNDETYPKRSDKQNSRYIQ